MYSRVTYVNTYVRTEFLREIDLSETHLAESCTSWPAALGVEKLMSMAAKAFGSGFMFLMQSNPGM